MCGGGYTFILNADTGQVCELNLGGMGIRVSSLEFRWSLFGIYQVNADIGIQPIQQT